MTERLIGHSWRFSHPSDKSRDKCAAGKSSPKPGSSKSQSRLSPAKAILLCETGSELFFLHGNWKASQESELPRSVGDRANTLQGQHKWQLYVVLYELYVGQNCSINVFLITFLAIFLLWANINQALNNVFKCELFGEHNSAPANCNDWPPGIKQTLNKWRPGACV